MTEFKVRVLKVVASIPKGSVMSYGEVAIVAGCPGAARAVGSIMSNNSSPKIPCHRVIKANGAIGAYNALKGESKEELLRKEGYIRKK